ncbi:MAG: GIY-YIG nuclease family protein [Desulfuromonas sp.]|nr:GIY-YIG nuclease family protein [Desulfuromonas sp.]
MNMPNTYYVYSLKDPREKPARLFYIGKGTGSRSTDHLKKIDNTRKGQFIQNILDSGHTPIISTLVKNLTEEQALNIELELISSMGTIDNGGSLYNSVIPKSIKRKVDDKVIVPIGALEKAQLGLQLLKDSIISLSEENLAGVTNSDCAHYLGLQSDNEGNQQDYLTYSILGILIKEGTLESFKSGTRRKYRKL